jgi:hypothetical protein
MRRWGRAHAPPVPVHCAPLLANRAVCGILARGRLRDHSAGLRATEAPGCQRSNHTEAVSEGKSSAALRWCVSFAQADEAMSSKRLARPKCIILCFKRMVSLSGA